MTSYYCNIFWPLPRTYSCCYIKRKLRRQKRPLVANAPDRALALSSLYDGAQFHASCGKSASWDKRELSFDSSNWNSRPSLNYLELFLMKNMKFLLRRLCWASSTPISTFRTSFITTTFTTWHPLRFLKLRVAGRRALSKRLRTLHR